MSRILFVDDDVLSLQLMSQVSLLLGCQAIVCASPRHALVLAANECPDLILVDMQMDEMDGSEFVRQMRSLPEIAHLPVIIYTAGVDYYDKDKALLAGANGFLEKPISVSLLSQTIQTYALPG
jgi:two-component system, cell cycle response regulator DivK